MLLYDYHVLIICFFFKQKTAYELRISDWSSDGCSSDLPIIAAAPEERKRADRSEQGNWLNCTPNSGPLSSPTVVGAGGKCCCTIMLAVRVEKEIGRGSWVERGGRAV